MTSSGRLNSNSAAARSSITRARSSTSRATSADANSSFRELAVRHSSPQPERLVEHLERNLRSIRRPEPNLYQLLEAQRVDVVGPHPQPVSRRPRLQAVFAERPAQP